MTPHERVERALENCFVGGMPADPWVLFAVSRIVAEIVEAESVAYLRGLRRALDIARDYTGQGVAIQAAIQKVIEAGGDGNEAKSALENP